MKNNIITSFTYHTDRKEIDYTNVTVDEIGNILCEENEKLCDMNQDMYLNIAAVEDFIIELHNLTERKLSNFKVVYTKYGEMITFAFMDQQLPATHQFLVIDDEVSEWIKVIKYYLLEYVLNQE